MKRILLTGYYGYGNSGDEGALEVLVQRLPRSLGEVRLTVLTHCPEETKGRYGVEGIPRMDPFRVWRALCACDLLLFGGGSLLQNATSGRSLLYYLAQLWAADRLHKPVVLLSQGIGPLKGRWAQRAVARALERAALLTLREELSRQKLMAQGVPGERLMVTGDLALLLPPPPPPEEGRENQVALIPGPGCGPAQRETLADLIRWLQGEGKQVVLIPLYPQQDKKCCEALARVCPNALLWQGGSPEEVLARLNGMELIISIRLHGLVYGAKLGVPLVGISYDPKVEGFLRQIDCWDGLTVEHLTLEGVQNACAQAALRGPRTAQRVAQLQRGLAEQEIWLRQLIEQGGNHAKRNSEH